MAHSPQYRRLVRLLQTARRLNLEAEGQRPPEPMFRTRRRFLKNATLAGGAALSAKILSFAQAGWSQPKPGANPGANRKVAIIGGGMAGLNAAYQLKKRGIIATVYEASSQLGGRIRSTSTLSNGIITDLGGSFINTDHEDMLALAKELKVPLINQNTVAQKLPFPTTAYYFNQKLIPEAEVAQKLRPLAAQIAKDAVLADKDDAFAAKIDQLSVAQYLDQYAKLIPEPFIRTLIESTVRSEYGVEPSESSAIQLTFILPVVKGKVVELISGSDEAWVATQGNGQLITKLAQALPGQIKPRSELIGLEAQGTGFQLQFKAGEPVTADLVIMAIPLTVLRQLKLGVQLPEELTRVIKELDLGRNEKIIGAFSQRVWRKASGFAQQLWNDIGITEVWDDSLRAPALRAGALTYFFGANEVKPALEGIPSAQGKILTSKLNAVIPGLEAAATGGFLRTAWGQDPLIQGSYTNFKPGQYTAFSKFRYVESEKPSERQDVHVNNLIFAGEHFSDEYYGYMNGAAQTGRLAAALALRLLKKPK
jgi:monoamine oxidase